MQPVGIKKVINSFLILVLVLQLLPVKQAVEYFFIKNPMAEELLHVNKGCEKPPRFMDEDHKALHLLGYQLPQILIEKNKHAFHYMESLPATWTADIQTPPPNQA